MKKVVALWFFIFVLQVNITAFAETNVNLQQLIDQTPEYGVIELDNQTYIGNLSITKPLTIIGSEKSVIRGDGTDNVISIHAEGVRVENVKIENSGKSRNTEEEHAGIKIHSNHNVLKDIMIDDSFHGVYLSQAHYNELHNISVTGMGGNTVAAQGNGIHVYYSNSNQLIDINVTGTRDGLFFDYSNDNEVVGNVLSETRYGLHFMYSNNNRFYNNRFVFNTGGAAIMNSHQNEVIGNEFSFNQSTRSFGLLLQMANENTICDNTFFQNQRGLFIDQSQLNRIENNQIFQNQIGVEIWASAKHQTFTNNHFFKNTAAVITAGGRSENNWSENGLGNYWGNTVPQLDLNQDGIGDFPVEYTSSLYQLIEENELAYLFLNSPTIAIYEKMNELLSRQQVMFVDDYPLLNNKEEKNNWLIVLFVLVSTGWILYRRWKRG
ncbi:nitrous oxide reductase family maturation protein NosD [Anaerobacillus sp. MEB173]|uniref:nitrous oxide reductase family maturation protein NosD n=1 Tax=Anaerobacillus sp. MEB173 TaxID=3383345 RepID=UPI003F939DF7